MKRRFITIFIVSIAFLVTFGLVPYGIVKNDDPSILQSLSNQPVTVGRPATDTISTNSEEAAHPEQLQNKTALSAGQDTSAQTAKALPNATEPPTASKVYYRDQVDVITYHNIDAEESSVTITQERFASHLKALKNNGFNVISIEDFADFLQKKKSVPPNAVVITFDDGYESVYKYAYPLLKTEGMPATVFLIVSYIEDGTARLSAIMNWDEISQMHNDGFSFYSHTYNAHSSVFVNGKEYSQLAEKLLKGSNLKETDAEYKNRIFTDLAKANEILNTRLGNKLNMLCLPHGAYNQAVLEAAAKTNTTFLFTGKESFNTAGAKLINRINAGSPYMTDSLLIRKLATTHSSPGNPPKRVQKKGNSQQIQTSLDVKTTAKAK